jgi:uncharacterized OsmC-like protein
METKKRKELINGVQVDELFATIDAIKETPAIASSKFRVTNKWIKGGHNHTTISDFFAAQEERMHKRPFELDADEPPLLLGEDIGPNPVEYLLTGLAACMTTGLVYHAAARGIELKSVESRLEGDIDLRGFLGISPDVKVGYKSIRVDFTIDADISYKQKEELIEMAQKYSPVFHTIFNATPITVKMNK